MIWYSIAMELIWPYMKSYTDPSVEGYLSQDKI